MTTGAELAPVGAPWRFMREDWNILGEAKRPMFRITIERHTYTYEDELATALFALMNDSERGKYEKGTVLVKKNTAKATVLHTLPTTQSALFVCTSTVVSKLDLIKFYRTIIPGFGLKESKDLADQTCASMTRIPEELYRHIGVIKFVELLRSSPLPIEFQIKEMAK